MDTAGEFPARSADDRHELHERRDPSLGQWLTLQPGERAAQVKRQGGEHVLQMGLGHTDVAGATQPTQAIRLSEALGVASPITYALLAIGGPSLAGGQPATISRSTATASLRPRK